MEKRYGLETGMLNGKLPGSDSQIVKEIVKEIASCVELFDRHQELLVLRRSDELPEVLEKLAHYNVEADLLELLLLPDDGVRKGPRYEDYIVETHRKNRYAVRPEVSFFELTTERPEAEAAPALMQLEEELIVALESQLPRLYAVDAQSEEWAERIASAYRCGIRWHRFAD